MTHYWRWHKFNFHMNIWVYIFRRVVGAISRLISGKTGFNSRHVYFFVKKKGAATPSVLIITSACNHSTLLVPGVQGTPRTCHHGGSWWTVTDCSGSSTQNSSGDREREPHAERTNRIRSSILLRSQWLRRRLVGWLVGGYSCERNGFPLWKRVCFESIIPKYNQIYYKKVYLGLQAMIVCHSTCLLTKHHYRTKIYNFKNPLKIR